MKLFFKKMLMGLVALVACVGLNSCGYERVDAGHEGILVNLYGDDKGVGDVSMCTGAVWYNPFTQSVYEYPTFVQTVDYEPFTINAKDGSEFTVDPTISLKIVNGKSPAVFKKYRKELKEVINGTLYNYVRDAFRIQLNNFSTDYIVSNRDSIEHAIERHLSAALLRENFQLEQLTSGLKYPETIVKAVNAKNEAIQRAQQAQNEVAVAEANAKKLLVAAQAEAEANRLKQQALTPQILEKMWIEKWDGKLPVYGQVPTLFKDITK
jgi:Membrane protease subunits, stomatin/prohibitin homologs